MRHEISDGKISTGEKPNDYHALVCSNYR